ncbi:MAG TPA: MFS transporter [Streptosporangiaceae bacterium]|jgi:predicted MFS family arabinose efflux permease|nr:MFS transporter [Streptosporangiaceae bacterium]
MTRTLTLLFAVAGGAAVGNLYYVQPLLAVIAASLHVGSATAGLLVTATQVGYATGLVLIVPLGDVRDRRRLIPLMMLASAVALAGCALAPTFVMLAAAMVLVGVTTVSGQILTPFAGDLTDDGSRGRVLGIVVSGLLTGILAARILGGLIAGVAGWRTVFALAAGLMVVLAALLWRLAPTLPPKTSSRYGALLRSVATLVRHESRLRILMALGMVSMATFTLFWTALTFLLSDRHYHYSTTIIGLFGLAGLVGTLAAQGAGRLHDRGWSNGATGVSWVITILAWLFSQFGQVSLGWLLAGVVVLDVGTQAQRILNQTRAFALSAEARSRINTAYVAGNFVGAALGSLAASLLWSLGGWTAVTVTGGGLSLLALAFWALTLPRMRE